LAAPITILAFDFGLSKMGIAVGQSVTQTATALRTLTVRGGAPDWTHVDALLNEWRPTRLVVGLPLNMDGTMSDMAETARAFAADLDRRYGLPIDLCDERLTSFEARGLSPDPDERHAIAARLIAESYLRERR
jgi:putative Holliday junction resolvase